MTTWNCTTDGTAFAVGAPRCPSCGSVEVRENGDGVRSAIVTAQVGVLASPVSVLEPLDTSNVHAERRTGTPAVRTIDVEGSTDAKDQQGRPDARDRER